MTSSSLPTFETPRLIIRPLCFDDGAAYIKYFAVWDVVRTLPAYIPWPYPRNGFDTFWASVVEPHQGKNQWFWALCLKENSKELIGCMELRLKGDPGHRGYWLARELWGQGLALEALKPLMCYAFDVLNFREVYDAHAKDNKNSHRIKEKEGAIFLREEPGEFVDPDLKIRCVWKILPSCYYRS